MKIFDLHDPQLKGNQLSCIFFALVNLIPDIKLEIDEKFLFLNKKWKSEDKIS